MAKGFTYTREGLIRAALKAYPHNEHLGPEYEAMGIEQLLAAARENRFGDKLASFLVRELAEGLDADGNGYVEPTDAGFLLERGAADLQAVADAFFQMDPATATYRRPQVKEDG
jgi:hypothetical protein